jgi:hypothetical protein
MTIVNIAWARRPGRKKNPSAPFDNPPPQPLEEFLPFMANQKVD